MQWLWIIFELNRLNVINYAFVKELLQLPLEFLKAVKYITNYIYQKLSAFCLIIPLIIFKQTFVHSSCLYTICSGISVICFQQSRSAISYQWLLRNTIKMYDCGRLHQPVARVLTTITARWEDMVQKWYGNIPLIVLNRGSRRGITFNS